MAQPSGPPDCLLRFLLWVTEVGWGSRGWEASSELEAQCFTAPPDQGGSSGPKGQRSLDQGCLAKGLTQNPHPLTGFARPTQDIFPKECVYIHDPTGLNVLKKGCASYCNQTVTVSMGMGALSQVT